MPRFLLPSSIFISFFGVRQGCGSAFYGDFPFNSLSLLFFCAQTPPGVGVGKLFNLCSSIKPKWILNGKWLSTAKKLANCAVCSRGKLFVQFCHVHSKKLFHAHLVLDSLILLQVQKRYRVPKADEGVFRNVADVVRAEVEVTKSVQRFQRLARYLMQIIVT